MARQSAVIQEQPGAIDEPLGQALPSNVVSPGSFRLVPFLLAVFLVSLFYVWTRAEVVKATYEMGSLQRQVEVQAQRNRKLRLESLALKAPDRLTAIAVETLGMKPPGEGQVLVVK